MKPSLFFIYILLSAQTVISQKSLPKPIAANPYAAVDKKALQMPDSCTATTEGMARFVNETFKTNTDRARAIFVWVATNIQYDLNNMFAINIYEQKEEKIAKALKSRQGICENFAALFTDVCTKSGIRSITIEGYTKQNGFADYIPHAWCAAFIDGAWQMFDPTWGAGYVNNNRFYKKINNDYFKADPASLLRSHMPFDYLWQLVSYPITNQEFYEGKILQNHTKPFFAYADSIDAYEKLPETQQLMAASERIERNGVKNAMIFDRLHQLKIAIENKRITMENDRQAQIIGTYNSATFNYNDGINIMNDFVQYRNKQFMPAKPDPEIQAMLDSAGNQFKNARAQLNSIKNPDASTNLMIVQLTKTIDEATTHLKEQQDWLAVYFTKGKAGRKSMFFERRTTLFGIPLH